MSKIIALFNQAGGVAKTTLTMNLGYHLSTRQHRVLLVDIDPQASLTSFMGIEPSELETTIYDALVPKDDEQFVLPIDKNLHGMDLLPSNIELANAEQQLIEDVFASVGRLSVESFRTHRLPLLNLPEDILSALRSGQIEYTKAKAIARVKDEETRKQLLEEAIGNSLSLSQIRELIKELKPAKQQEELRTRFDTTYKQAKKAKKLWSDAKKRKQLESLLAKLEKLIAEEKWF